MIFKGSGVAICTPFTQNGINFDTFEKLIEFQIANDTDAIIVCGTTGEPSTMTDDEQASLIQFAVKTVDKRIPVIAGIGGNNTAHVIHCAKVAQDLGADGLLGVTPYYNKCTNAGLIAHFNAVADATDLPIILYNVPARTSVNICPSVFAELCQHKNIAAIKEASGNISQIAEMARVCRGYADVYSGNDDHVVPVLSLGGVGVISVVANLMPKYMHNMVTEYQNGNTAKACEMQLEINTLGAALFAEVNPIPVKTALRLMNFDMGPFRLPLTEIAHNHLDSLIIELKKFGLYE
ncbi:MAG: 4-hydroxy-tetrahydrodipicolinate synthase [Christensenellaceae bacterium]